MSVQHSLLTGSSLHEPKGVAAASASRVYVSNGAGSGSWTTVSNAVLASAAKAFQAQLLHVADVKAQNTDSGAFTAGAWQTRVLNTTLTNEIGASLAANQITLLAGTYYIEATAPAIFVDQHRLRLQNITDGTTALLGPTIQNPTGTSSEATLKGRLVAIAATKVFELQHRCQTTRLTDGFGPKSNWDAEKFAEAMIWKVA